VHSEELKAKEQSLVELGNEKAAHEEHVRMLQAKIEELETQNGKLAGERASVQKQLSSANGAIEQFNLLCRRSEEEKSLLEKQIKKMLEEHEALRTPHTVAAENARPSPEMLPALQKPLSSHENGCVQTSLCHLYGLLQDTESKLTLLVSEGRGMLDKDSQEQEVNITAINNITEFDSFESVLGSINSSVTKVLEWRDKLILEMETKKQSNEALRNELFDLKKRTGIKVLNGEKLNKVSYSTQTEEVNTESTGSQTVNNDILNYKRQIDAFQKEIAKLKGSLKTSDIEHCERRRKYESSVRTLLKKVKEHMRGRKLAERALEELHGNTEENMELLTLKRELSKLQAELEASKKSCEEQKRIADRNQEALLVLEKEQGKLAQSCSISREKLPTAAPDGKDMVVSNEFDQKTRELQLLQTQGKITDLEEEIRKSHIIIKELRKEVSKLCYLGRTAL
jgi:DNA repair exonuclease SbcCD ATPase subunit